MNNVKNEIHKHIFKMKYSDILYRIQNSVNVDPCSKLTSNLFSIIRTKLLIINDFRKILNINL